VVADGVGGAVESLNGWACDRVACEANSFYRPSNLNGRQGRRDG
jgi:hypothetical protein